MLGQIVQRQFAPVLAMLTEAIHTCPDDLFCSPTVGVREHIYHVLVGMDVWLHPDPGRYPFDQIADNSAANLQRPADDPISKQFLLDYVAKIEGKVADRCAAATDLLAEQTIRGTSFATLDLCLSQLRHPMYHLGAINRMLAAHGSPTVKWQGYGE